MTRSATDVSLDVRSDVELAAKLFRGFGEPLRLAILRELAGGEVRVTDLVARVGGSQANVSGHLACLKDCGLVSARPEGRQVFYAIAQPEVVAMLRAAEALLAKAGDRVQLCPNYRIVRRRSR
ncbi:MAG: ArsR/SmtB family transcription factor [Actinomycetota bacterium]